MTDFVLKVSPELASSLRSEDQVAASELLKIISAHGAKIGPPTGSVGEAALYHSIEDVDAKRSDALSRALMAVHGVDAAYAKPADELP